MIRAPGAFVLLQRSAARSTTISPSHKRVAFETDDSSADDGLLMRVPAIDDVLAGYASALGNDFVAYRNHVYRVMNLCVAIMGGRGEFAKIAFAAVFHDLGIWTDRTFDDIAPSIALARQYLIARAQASRLDRRDTGLEEIGYSAFVCGASVPAWPDAGFHWRLVQLALHRFRTHPLRPLPMVRL